MAGEELPCLELELGRFEDFAGARIRKSMIDAVTKNADAKRLIPDGKFYGPSLWINNSNRSNRQSLVKEWLEKNKIK